MGDFFKQYGWLLNLGFILSLAYFLARISNVYIGSWLEVPRSIAVAKHANKVELPGAVGDFEDYRIIVERNVFNSSETSEAEPCVENDQRAECKSEVEEEPVAANGEAVPTSLPIKVLSTVVVGDGKDGRSTATIDAGGKKGVDVYEAGDKVHTFAPGVLLVRVKPKRIEFMHNNRLEYAELVDDAGLSIFVPPEKLSKTGRAGARRTASNGVPNGSEVRNIGGNKYTVGQAEIDAALSNLDQLYTQIRAVPNFNQGKVKGMKILSIKPGSLFSKLGLRRGDVLDRINGQQIDIKSGFSLFNQLKQQRQFTLDLIRGGKTETFEYEIK